MVDYGVDIASHGKLDSRGQIPLVSGTDNVRQSLINRILTYEGTYSYIDEDYGSVLKDYLGLDNNQLNQNIVCLELETQCLKDPRVVSVKAEYRNRNYDLHVTLANGEDLEIEGLL
jgi:hypothetical protein